MSKRARQMALMGFMTGALGDVMRRREQSRLEAAEERKEARLAAIRAEEKAEDRAFTREQFEAQQGAMNTRDERNFEQQKEYFGMTDAEADKRDERNFAQQQQLAAEQRGHAERMQSERIASGTDDTGRPRNPEIKSFINDATGKVHTYDVNNPAQLAKLQEWGRTQPIRPYYASSAGGGGQVSAPTAPPVQSPVRKYNPKTGRVE